MGIYSEQEQDGIRIRGTHFRFDISGNLAEYAEGACEGASTAQQEPLKQ